MTARILLVENNPITRKGITTLLVESGYQVVEAANAVEMQSILDQAPVELALIACGMPGVDLLELLQEIHARASNPIAPVLALTEEPDEPRLLSLGFTDVLIKPIDPARLQSAVRIHLARVSSDPPGEGRRLLLVDSNLRTLRLSARRFEQLGFEVSTASSGSEALDDLSENLPSVVVSELLGEPMDGFELCQAIHAMPEHVSRPVILVSVQHLTQADREFAARVGATACVTRTGDLNALVDAVLEALRPRSRSGRVESSIPVSGIDRKHAISTLEHRAHLREDLARRDGTLRAVRSVLDCLNESSGHSRDDVLYGALAGVLHATGFSLGASFLRTAQGSLELRGQIGFAEESLPEVRSFWGHLPLLWSVLETGAPRGACVGHAVGSIQQLLATAALGSIIVIPLSHGSRRLGVLVLCSRNPRLTSDWLLLSETVAGSLGFAVALAETASQLVETETRFSGIADSTSEGIAVCNAQGEIGYANAALLRLLALASSEVVGHKIDEVVPFLAHSAASGQGALVRGNGETVPAEAIGRTVQDPLGRPCRVYVVRDLSERQHFTQVAWLASHDALTGLYNRHRFQEGLSHRLSESRRYKASCAVLLLDVDHFKLINDTYGHQAGDSVLTAIADVLRTATRQSDLPARLGGDEFVVLLPHAGLEQARSCSIKLLERVRQLKATHQGWSLPVSVSIGVAVHPQHGDLPEALIMSADEALYRAKRAGRNQICVQDSLGSRAQSGITAVRTEPATPVSTEPPPLGEELAQNA